MHHPYRSVTHGLTLACDAALPVRGTGSDADGPADVVVDWAGVAANGRGPAPPLFPPPDPPVSPPGSQVIVEATGGWLAVSPLAERGPGWTRLQFGYGDHHVQFDVDPNGARVVVTWTPAVPTVHVHTLLFSTVMGYLLHRLGRFALHAGVVAWQGAAFVFAGAPGAGKSTTLGALVQRGCTNLSDDAAVLTRRADGWAVFPGPAGIRLTPAAQAALRIPAAATAPLWPRSEPLAGVDYERLEDKAVVSFGGEAEWPAGASSVPLAGVFLLPPLAGDRAAPRVTAVPPTAAVPHLIAHLLTPAWLPATVNEQRFAEVVDVARSTPVRSVERPDDLAALPSLGDVLVEEMERLRP